MLTSPHRATNNTGTGRPDSPAQAKREPHRPPELESADTSKNVSPMLARAEHSAPFAGISNAVW